MMMSSQLRHTMALVVIEVAIMMTSSQLRHLVVIVYKWKRSDNESDERRGQFKVPGKFAPYVSYHRPGRERARMRSGERRVTANGRPERAPPRRGLCAIGVLYFVSILDKGGPSGSDRQEKEV